MMDATLTIGPTGQVTIPPEVLDRYGVTPATPVRLIETRHGILIVPLGDAPMSAPLAVEIAEWQALGAEGLEGFPFELSD